MPGEKNVVSPPLVLSEKIVLPPLRIKLALMKNFVKDKGRTGRGFECVRNKSPNLRDAKIKEGILNKDRPTWCRLLFFISLFNAQRVSNVNTFILRSLRLIVDLFHVFYWSGSMCVGVTVWLGCFSLHKDTTPPQPNHNVTPTCIVPEQYNTWNNSTNKSQAPEDGCINIRKHVEH